jgi:AraC-like DNA-binding protein
MRRIKEFGEGPRQPLDREAKVRIMHRARALKYRTEKGKHYGLLTGKFVDVLQALVWLIHDSRSGQCNPSYETIASKAHCARSTVAEAISALEAAGILSWVQRIRRVRERVRDELLGGWVLVWRVVRTSNAYLFHDPGGGNTAKSEFRTGPIDVRKKEGLPSLPPELAAALEGLGRLIEGRDANESQDGTYRHPGRAGGDQAD